MRRDRLNKTNLILAAFGLIPVTWIAVLVAPALGGGLPSLVKNLAKIFNHPFYIEFCEDSLKTVLIFIGGYILGLCVYFAAARNYRRREEHGSAEWGNAETVNKKYQDTNTSNNKILTNSVAIGLDGRKHMRNLNILVCGGSGAGKTRFFAKPNIMQANSSFVILDPKGEILRDTGRLNDLMVSGSVRKGFMILCAVVLAVTMLFGTSLTAFAEDQDPLTVVNNLSTFMFGLIRAVGLILLGFGIVQVGLSLKSHDPSQRANGFLTVAGGIVITFAKEILTLITG